MGSALIGVRIHSFIQVSLVPVVILPRVRGHMLAGRYVLATVMSLRTYCFSEYCDGLNCCLCSSRAAMYLQSDWKYSSTMNLLFLCRSSGLRSVISSPRHGESWVGVASEQLGETNSGRFHPSAILWTLQYLAPTNRQASDLTLINPTVLVKAGIH
jgi:hypothetical protein